MPYKHIIVLVSSILLAVAVVSVSRMWYEYSNNTGHGPSSVVSSIQSTEKDATSPQASHRLSLKDSDVKPAPLVQVDMKHEALERFLDKTQGPSRITSDITAKIPVVRQEDIGRVVAVMFDADDDDTVRNEAICILRRSGYQQLTDDLIKILNSHGESPRFRAFCVQHLWMNTKKAGPDELGSISTTLRTLLSDRDLPVRREALLALVRMGDPLGQETAVKWLLDENASDTRDLAIRCIHDLNLKQYIPTIRKYLYDPDEVIRIAAIVALSQWGDEESRPAFSAAAKSDSIRLQRAGQAALTRLSQPAKTP